MSKIQIVHTTTSEDATLKSRGYKLLTKLGEGTYAKVYLGEFRTTANPKIPPSKLACKIIDITRAQKEFVKKFLPRELKILVHINHPHIIHIHSIFQRRNKYFIFMRFAEKGDLLEFILENGGVSENQSRLWSFQLALAIQYLFHIGIAHRDLKCENILVTANYNIKLSDFGFSRYVVDHKNHPVLSQTYCGSLSYASPEILKGIPYSPEISDIWSYGIILYTMLNKSMPFDDNHVKTLLENQLKKQWKFRARVIDILSEQVKNLIKKLLEPDPLKRLRIDEILNSNWFAMDSRLKAFNTNEFTTGMEQSKHQHRHHHHHNSSNEHLKRPTCDPGINFIKDISEENVISVTSEFNRTSFTSEKYPLLGNTNNECGEQTQHTK